MDALGLHVIATIFPVNTALDLAFEVSWIFGGCESHLDVDVSIGFKFTRHRL